MTSSFLNRIKPLSIQLANQIAAGEVVERPASVIKELLENSIDAASTEIEVDISQGGKSLIRLKDNGWGIKKDDLPLAVSRHATSKLHVIEDLNSVNSLGFRGEALASISSISRLSIISKYAKSDKAWGIDTGSDTDFTNYQAEVLPAALSVGTVIEVCDLFYNTPARRKFLRTDKTEFRYIEDVFKRIAMSHFDVAFKLTHNKKLIKKISTAVSAADKLFRLQKLLGENFVQQLKEVNQSSQNFHNLGCLQLTGWISNESYVRSYADQQFFYVNGRYVRDKLLNHALRQAYQENLNEDQYAAYVLYLTIDPQYVDVNVHPTKHEIRFSHSRMVHDFIVSAITRTLSPSIFYENERERESVINSTTIQTASEKIVDNQNNYSKPYVNSQHAQKKSGSSSLINDHIDGLSYLYKKTLSEPSSDKWLHENQLLTSPVTPFSAVAPFSDELDHTVFNGKILALIGTTILAQQEDKLWMIDSLSAAKNISYQLLTEPLVNKKTLENNDSMVQKKPDLDFLSPDIRTQKLLIPENISLTQNDCDILLKWQQQLVLLGVEFTFSGPENLMLRVIPKLPFAMNNKLMISNIASFLQTSELTNKVAKLNQQYRQLLVKTISNSLNPLQTFDKQQQQIILNYISKSMYYNNQFTENYKQSYQILNGKDMKKIIGSK